MFGGAPIQQFPSFAPMQVSQPYPAAGQGYPSAGQGYPMAPPQVPYPPAQVQAQPVPFPPQGWKAQPPVQQVAAPSVGQPTFRGKKDEEPPPPPPRAVALALPSPEAFGIAPASAPAAQTGSATGLDWNVTRARLDGLKASFSLTRQTDGNYRMVITLPTANPDQAHLVDVMADSEALAVATALQRAEQWSKQ
jgi:hypothetical protein